MDKDYKRIFDEPREATISRDAELPEPTCITMAEANENLIRIRAQFEGRTFSDSVELLREDRER